MSLWDRRVWWWVLGAFAALGCDTPSSQVDGGDLHGVFERDASADGAAPSASATATATATAKRDAGPALPKQRREPVTGPCVQPLEPQAAPRSPQQRNRVAKRPRCPAARILEWQDAERNPRYACLLGTRRAAKRAPLPVLLFFHDDEQTPREVRRKTDLRTQAQHADLTGDPNHLGFVVLAVQGRLLDGRLTFDTADRTLDNPDVKTVDHFFGELEQDGLVDHRRIYAVGDGNGVRMAMLYSYLRSDRIAAMALFAGEASGIRWSCTAEPPPALVLYRACDAVVPCDQVESWLREREDQGLTTSLRLGAGKATEPNCTPKRQCKEKRGRANHARWPKSQEPRLLEFLARFSLDRDP